MRKLKLQINITIDGFVARENGELDWMLPESDPKHLEYLKSITASTDTILLGKNMALESIAYWQKTAESDNSNPENEFAKFFTDTPKIVFSKSLKSIEGKNVALENGCLDEAIHKLKIKSGNDLIVYGGAQFVSSLLTENLIDELNLFVHPVSLGKGLPIFNSTNNLNLSKSETYANGIVLHQYEI